MYWIERKRETSICCVTFVCTHWLILFLKLYFIDYSITMVSIFLFCLPPPSTPHSLRRFPHHCSCPWVMSISSVATPFPILCFTSPRLFSNYLFVLLNPLTSSSNHHDLLPSGNLKTLFISMILSLFLFA